MISQKKLIHKEEWDYLLILDASRYDLFKEKYSDYFNGDLKSAWSEGSNTIEWLTKTFPNYYDITYIAGNAFINSKNIRGLNIMKYKRGYPHYSGPDHFKKIIDTWDKGYDVKRETVLPDAINEDLRNCDDEKIIAHYILPHFPWVNGYKEINTNRNRRKEFKEGCSEPRFSRCYLYETFGGNKVREAYEDNLEVALQGISRVLGDLKGKIIVSADHGELLSEKEGHPPCRDDPELRVVPWCEIND